MAVKKTKTTKKAIKKKCKGNPNPKHKFARGNKFGKGRPTMTPEEKALTLSSRTQFKTLLAHYMTWTSDKINDALEELSLPVLDIAVLRCLKEASENGSMDRVDWSLNHVLGKPKEQTHISLSGSVENTQTIDLSKLSKEELIALKAMAEKSKGKK